MRVSDPPHKITAPHDHLAPGRPARNEQERARLRAEIKTRYAKKDKRSNPYRHIALLRMPDLEKLCRASDDPGDDWEYLTAAANHLSFIYGKTNKIAAIVKWSQRFTRSIPTDQAKLLTERIAANPRIPTADKLAWRLGLTMAKRTELGITTIGAIGSSKAKRAAQRRKKRARAEGKRRAARRTGKPRGRPSKGKPWEVAGISKRTHYRREKRKQAQADADQEGSGTKMRGQHSLTLHAGHGISCHLPQQALQPPVPTFPSRTLGNVRGTSEEGFLGPRKAASVGVRRAKRKHRADARPVHHRCCNRITSDATREGTR